MLSRFHWASLQGEATVHKVYWANDRVQPLEVGLTYAGNISKHCGENSPGSKRISFHVWLDAAIFAGMQIKKKCVGNDEPLWQINNPRFRNEEVHSDTFTLMFSWQIPRTCFVAETKRSTSAGLLRGSNIVSLLKLWARSLIKHSQKLHCKRIQCMTWEWHLHKCLFRSQAQRFFISSRHKAADTLSRS